MVSLRKTSLKNKKIQWKNLSKSMLDRHTLLLEMPQITHLKSLKTNSKR